ncbi:MAG: haloacid dehalogenase [Crenarchaeota archaeon]|nr:haloacid dehalogenase [Thermoproteota archaeon]
MPMDRESVRVLRERLSEYIARIDKLLSKREEERDKMIKLSRDVIRLSGQVINAIHTGDYAEASKLLQRMEDAKKEFISHAKHDPYLYHTGLVYSTLAEYVEAKILYSLVVESKPPAPPEELDVPETAYLQGLGDVVGELRRLALDALRQDRIEDAEHLLAMMEAIYMELRGLEYPDALIPGVRRKVDVARRLIDDTKALLVEVKGRRELARLLHNITR